MWRKMRLIKIILILLAAATSASAAVSVTVEDDAELRGCPPDYPFKDDNLRIVLKSEKKIVGELNFCSTYGKSEAKIETDAKDKAYVFLKHGEGRGTNARKEFLTIFTATKNPTELLRLPLSGPAGPFSNWYYDYSVTKPKGGGFSLRMKLRVDGEDAVSIPAERTKTITIK